MYVTRFKVQGTYVFPLDMLRYDGCYPSSQDDVTSIIVKEHPNATREERAARVIVELSCRHSERTWTPTEGRWSSFGWGVVPGSVKTQKV